MSEIVNTLIKDEGFIPTAKQIKTQAGGKEKNYTLGYGYNIQAAADPRKDLAYAGIPEGDIDDVLKGKKSITEAQGKVLLNVSAKRAEKEAARVVVNYDKLPDPIKGVMVEMAYQLGAKGLKDFKNMRAALVRGDYEGAAKELLNSELARNQSSSRAKAQAKRIMDYAKSEENTQKKNPSKDERMDLLRQRKRQLMIQRTASDYQPSMRMQELAKLLRSIKPEGKEKDASAQ